MVNTFENSPGIEAIFGIIVDPNNIVIFDYSINFYFFAGVHSQLIIKQKLKIKNFNYLKER